MDNPIARADDLIVKKLVDETLVYDCNTQKVHSLNAAAAVVWQHCDGNHTIANLVARIQEKLGVASNEAAVENALADLSQHRLLKTSVPKATSKDRLSRRKMLGQLTTALALPVVLTVTAPHAKAQASVGTTPPLTTPPLTTPPLTTAPVTTSPPMMGP